jgi:hypothetical protein
MIPASENGGKKELNQGENLNITVKQANKLKRAKRVKETEA